MPNGKPGDHPITDIVAHHLPVYSPAVDALVEQIVQLGGRDRIADLLLFEFNQFRSPDVQKLEKILSEIRDSLKQQAV